MAGPNTPYFYRSGGGSGSAASGGTGKNYLTTYKASTGAGAANTGNGDIELGATTGFSLGNVGTLTNGVPTGTSPTFGSGASGNLSIATANTSTLGGLFSLDIISAAATTAGDCVATSAFNIDAEDQGRVLSFRIAYKAQTNPTNGNWSGTSSSSYGVAVWDATNSVFLGVAGQFNFVQSSGVGYATGTFQTGTTTASLRLMIYNANASSNAITLRTDDWSCGPQVNVSGPALSDDVLYTPIYTGLGTVSVTAMYWSRDGDKLRVRGTFTIGSPTGTEARISFPVGLTSASTIGTLEIAGPPLGNPTSAATFFFVQPLREASKTYFTLGIQQSTTNNMTKGNGNAIFTGSQALSFEASVPIAGWSSNSSQSNDTDTRVVAARMTGATATITGSYSDVTWTTIANDTHAAMGAINYTVPVTGYYDIAGALNVGAATVSAAGGFFIGLNNGSVILENELLFDLNVPENESIPFNYGSVLINAGTAIKIQIKTSGTIGTPIINSSATLNFLSIKRISGPAVIAATESVGAAYTDVTGVTLTTAYVTYAYATKLFDTHTAMGASGFYVTPVSGKYELNAAFATQPTNVAGSTWGINIAAFCGATQFAGGWCPGTGASMTLFASCDGQVNCNAGQTLYIQIKGAVNAIGYTGFGFNTLSIKRVGN